MVLILNAHGELIEGLRAYILRFIVVVLNGLRRVLALGMACRVTPPGRALMVARLLQRRQNDSRR